MPQVIASGKNQRAPIGRQDGRSAKVTFNLEWQAGIGNDRSIEWDGMRAIRPSEEQRYRGEKGKSGHGPSQKFTTIFATGDWKSNARL